MFPNWAPMKKASPEAAQFNSGQFGNVLDVKSDMDPFNGLSLVNPLQFSVHQRHQLLQGRSDPSPLQMIRSDAAGAAATISRPMMLLPFVFSWSRPFDPDIALEGTGQFDKLRRGWA